MSTPSSNKSPFSFKSQKDDVQSCFREHREPMVSVGIMHKEEISLTLHHAYLCQQTNKEINGDLHISLCNNELVLNGQTFSILSFIPQHEDCLCLLQGVTIGIGFHWEQEECQTFQGNIHLIVVDNEIQVINQLGIEQYLRSVIGSEMSATSELELLKAHAVISRSWLLSPMVGKESDTAIVEQEHNEEITRWYERDAHTLFDVCADDHCQRYQGVSRINTPTVEQALRETCGELLMMNEEVCDARFSKSCGGVTELFSNCWSEESEHPYLAALNDSRDTAIPDLTKEEEAERWIRSSAPSFCNVTDPTVLRQVLNSYDQETPDFYRWTIHYSNKEISEIIKEKSGIDFGKILKLEPLTRGTSGRITRLRIVGEKRTIIVGKELEIRKWLSKSHLYSSAFVVDSDSEGFTLTGAGWGHGVGLCQIGAAAMAHEGFSYQEILAHYFPGASLTKQW